MARSKKAAKKKPAAKKKSTKKKAAPKRKTAKKAAKKSTRKASTKRKSTKKTAKSSASAQTKAAQAAARAMRDIIARARDHFRQAPAERAFVLVDGRSLQDLKALAEAMEDMALHTFHHHVSDHRHDFANWVHDVLHERALAEQLRNAVRHPESHQRVIYRHIVRRVW